MIRQITIGTIVAVILGIIPYFVIPAVLELLLLVLKFMVMFLDPLHAEKNVKSIFGSGDIEILILPLAYTLIISPIVGISSAILARNIQSKWVYAAGAFVSFTAHNILVVIFGGISLIFADKDLVLDLIILSLILTTITSPIIGLISMAFVRKFSPKRE